MKLIFNYENIFYSFFYDDVGACVHRSREYAINYVYSGEMVLDNGEEQIHVAKGECVFIPRDHHITLYKKPIPRSSSCPRQQSLPACSLRCFLSSTRR